MHRRDSSNSARAGQQATNQSSSVDAAKNAAVVAEESRLPSTQRPEALDAGVEETRKQLSRASIGLAAQLSLHGAQSNLAQQLQVETRLLGGQKHHTLESAKHPPLLNKDRP